MKRIILISICLILFFSLKPFGISAQSIDDRLDLLIEIKHEIIASIAKQTGLEKGSIEIMVSSDSVVENIDVYVSVNLPKDAKIDEATIQQIVESIIRIISKKENATISEENIEITIH
ncbi:hypothetical protein OBCHQ24_15170 [Oceanobacillus iheyensis]|nr:hypothetical protein OBCHQ24_15170 [Oceanobacillus iheyensis]